MKLLRVLLFVLFGTTLAAQTPPASQQHFSMSGNVVSYFGPSGSAPASLADGYFNLTANVSIGYQHITIPSIATLQFGMVAYSRPLSSWVGQKLTKKFVFDATKVQVTAFGGLGKLVQDNFSVNRMAETGGACIAYPIAANVSVKLVCGQYIHGGIVNGFLTTGVPSSPTSNNASVSSGLAIHF